MGRNIHYKKLRYIFKKFQVYLDAMVNKSCTSIFYGKLFELRGFNFSFVSFHIIREVPCQEVHASNAHKITN